MKLTSVEKKLDKNTEVITEPMWENQNLAKT